AGRSRDADRPLQRDPHALHALPHRRRLPGPPGPGQEALPEGAALVWGRLAGLGGREGGGAAGRQYRGTRPAPRRAAGVRPSSLTGGVAPALSLEACSARCSTWFCRPAVAGVGGSAAGSTARAVAPLPGA